MQQYPLLPCCFLLDHYQDNKIIAKGSPCYIWRGLFLPQFDYITPVIGSSLWTGCQVRSELHSWSSTESRSTIYRSAGQHEYRSCYRSVLGVYRCVEVSYRSVQKYLEMCADMSVCVKRCHYSEVSTNV